MPPLCEAAIKKDGSCKGLPDTPLAEVWCHAELTPAFLIKLVVHQVQGQLAGCQQHTGV